MDAADIEDVFAPAARVDVRRMFGGKGIFTADRMVGLESGGVIYLKIDAETEPAFVEAGCECFSYGTKTGRTVTLPYRRLPEEAFEDPDALRRWYRLAVDAAFRQADSKKTRQSSHGRGKGRKAG
ncbi:TfoX/Sxy family protein [uncultured Alsobacter sp.]|uniref:TfoX/Sxy family protein n=1 Tax=uncultured Alsobacter sp. TaxID=1748258 RepID=UPI0025DDB5A2|nr:TfoX/Sxy family protein [uncultured Alsobacter sp.]